MSQGPKIKSTRHPLYAQHDLYNVPVVYVNSKGIPAPLNSIADPALKQASQMAAQGSVRETLAIMTEEHGPLDLAEQPKEGQIIVLHIRVDGNILKDPE